MADTTLEEARRCPTCEELGAPAGQRPAPERRQGTLHIFKCVNPRCKKVDRDWIVQVRPDGTIPAPTLNRDKSFPQDGGVAKSRIEKARANADATLNNSISKR